MICSFCTLNRLAVPLSLGIHCFRVRSLLFNIVISPLECIFLLLWLFSRFFFILLIVIQFDYDVTRWDLLKILLGFLWHLGPVNQKKIFFVFTKLEKNVSTIFSNIFFFLILSSSLKILFTHISLLDTVTEVLLFSSVLQLDNFYSSVLKFIDSSFAIRRSTNRISTIFYYAHLVKFSFQIYFFILEFPFVCMCVGLYFPDKISPSIHLRLYFIS